MLGAFTLAGLLLQLAVRSDALSISQSLGPLEDDDALAKRGDKGVGKEDDEGVGMEDDEGGIFVYDVDEDTHWNKAVDSNSLITDIDNNLQPARPAMDPEEKARQLAQKFTAQFVSELDVSKARETGELLGMQLCMMEEFNPPKVCKVKKWGLVNDWNEQQLKEGHPDKQIIVGDEISKVNQIEWKHNSKMFAKRISDQFMNSRKLGGRDTIELHIRRPKPDDVPDKRTLFQRQDRHKFLYAKEWNPEIATQNLKKDWPWTRKPMEQPESDSMGWTLDHPNSYKPVTISKIKPHGFLDEWNAAHPLHKIVEGDELVQVDDYSWKHNTTLFMERITYIMHHIFSDGKLLKLGIRRPREVQENLDSAEKALEHPNAEDDAAAPVLPDKTEHDHLNVQAKKAEEVAEDDDGMVGGGGSSEEATRGTAEKPPNGLDEAGKTRTRTVAERAEERRRAAEAEEAVDDVAKKAAEVFREAAPDEEANRQIEVDKPPARADPQAAAAALQGVEEISCSKTFYVKLRVPGGSNSMGWLLASPSKAPPHVSKIRDQGAVAAWNALHPEKIEVGDEILSVETLSSGSIDWKDHSESFAADVNRMADELATAERRAPFLDVKVKRSWRETRLKGQQQNGSSGSTTAGALYKESPKTSAVSRSNPETVASIRSKMEDIANALSKLDPENSVALASELFSKALASTVTASVRSAHASKHP